MGNGYPGYGGGMGISQSPWQGQRPYPGGGPVGPWQGPNERGQVPFLPPAQGPQGTAGGGLPPMGIGIGDQQLGGGYGDNQAAIDNMRRYAQLGLAQQLGPTGGSGFGAGFNQMGRALPGMGIATPPANTPSDPGFSQPGGMFAPYGYGGQRQISGFGSTPWGIAQSPMHLPNPGGATGMIAPRGIRNG